MEMRLWFRGLRRVGGAAGRRFQRVPAASGAWASPLHVISGSRFVAAAKVVHIWQDDVDLAVPESSPWTGLSDQRVQHRTPLIGERKVSRVIALHQIPDEQVLGGGMGHACLHPIRVGSETEQQQPFRHGEFGGDSFGSVLRSETKSKSKVGGRGRALLRRWSSTVEEGVTTPE
jgi:hypothetical protein